ATTLKRQKSLHGIPRPGPSLEDACILDFGYVYNGKIVQGPTQLTVLYTFQSEDDMNVLHTGVKENKDGDWFIEKGRAVHRTYRKIVVEMRRSILNQGYFLYCKHHPEANEELLRTTLDEGMKEAKDLQKHRADIPWAMLIDALHSSAHDDAKMRASIEDVKDGTLDLNLETMWHTRAGTVEDKQTIAGWAENENLPEGC
ncbi:hypothetical protein EVJ58_g8565, partial [Rhodofomes roseus]